MRCCCSQAVSCALAMPFVATLSACGPLRLLRPRVLEQLTPPVVELVDYLPNVDEPNKAVLARLFATGGLTKARVRRDGRTNRRDGRLRRARRQALWRMQTGSGIHGSIMTYAVRGKQYVAVTTGWGGWVKGFAPELAAAPRGGALFVFALP
jgi:hypothetical protein